MTTKAPWTQAEVDALNARQDDFRFHPYTCGSGHRTDEKHLDGEGRLVATVNGWMCPYCDYRQDWAHVVDTELSPEQRRVAMEIHERFADDKKLVDDLIKSLGEEPEDWE